jgi:hypothetical protein
MYTVGIRVPTRQIRDFSTFSVSSALRHSPSVRYASTVLQMTYVDFWIYLAKTLSPLRTLSVLGKVTRLIIILCKFHIVHLGYVLFVS